MNNKELEQLFKLLENTDIYEFELEKPNSKVRIKRGHVPHEVSPGAAIPSKEEGLVGPKAAKEEAGKIVKESKNIKYLVSPMVGTFYRAPSPGSQPYVEKGDKVSKGQAMCIIEAMKLFNEIESDVRGKIIEILVENGKPVEYGEKLFAIDIS
jgi:acetyl-CoA carboxylase biotin carboxyl carrier protein